jgi:hypothetical protein
MPKKNKIVKKKTEKKQLKKAPAKKTAKKIRQQKELIRAIKTPERFFKIDFGRYGGEVAMGEITEAQYNYWNDRDQSDFENYMTSKGFGDENEEFNEVPDDAKIQGEFFEHEDICHTSGPEFSDGQYMLISEVDKDGQPLQDEEGNFLEDRSIDMKDFKKLGVKIKCVAEHNEGSKSCKDKFFMFGQYFNKGGWYTAEPIKTGPAGFDFKKMAINYENCDGFRVFNSFDYDGENHYLEEDSTGKSSAFYVRAGDDV